MISKILYLVIDDDDHIDPVYHLRYDKQVALDLAQRLVNKAKERYKDMPSYPYPCNGKEGWWFMETGEEHWKVAVREVRLQ